MTYAVETSHLSKSIDGSVILNDVTLRVKQGEIYGFLGANGAGKTSLMKTLYHIMAPDAGTITLLGERVEKGNHSVFSRIGSIIESPVFYQHLSARENLELHCGYMGAGYERIGEMLAMLGLSETDNKAVGKFSLGMKQRLALARAFLTKPELLILDHRHHRPWFHACGNIHDGDCGKGHEPRNLLFEFAGGRWQPCKTLLSWN